MKTSLNRGHFRLAPLALGCMFILVINTALLYSAEPETLTPANMVLIPAGEFLMGSAHYDADERPPHKVVLPAFYIDKYEVTCSEYARFIQATGHNAPVDWPNGQIPPNRANYPVVNVSWTDARDFATWAGKRLPREEEWEKAARGSDGRVYPWGSELARKKIAAGESAKSRLYPVGSFPDDSTATGVFDMAGNAWEWTDSWYQAYPGNTEVELEYGEKYKVIRGGGAIEYYGAPASMRCSDRARSVPFGTYDGLGFRCVIDAK